MGSVSLVIPIKQNTKMKLKDSCSYIYNAKQRGKNYIMDSTKEQFALLTTNYSRVGE